MGIFEAGSNVTLVGPGPGGGTLYSVPIAAGQQFSDPIVMKAAADSIPVDPTQTPHENALEEARLTVLPVTGSYTVVDWGEDIKKQKENDAFNRVDLHVLEAVTRFGTVNNSPVSHNADAINYDDVDQGRVKDCSFMAALMALASSDPQWIVEHTTETGSGVNKVFTVELYDTSSSQWKTYTYNLGNTNLLDKGWGQAELTKNYHWDNDGNDDDGVEIWPLLYEKAFTELNGGPEANAKTAWRALTGKGAERKKVPGGGGCVWIREEISSAFSAGEIVTIGTRVEIDPDIVSYYLNKGPSSPAGDHSYLVDGITDSSGTNGKLDLKNPWGHDNIKLEYQHYWSVIENIYILEPTNP